MGRRMRESVSAAWWGALGALGLSHSRWLALPHRTRRVVKALIWVGIGLLLIVFFGVWKTSALAIAAVILLLAVPAWNRLSIRASFVVVMGLPRLNSDHGRSSSSTSAATRSAAGIGWDSVRS